MIYFDTIENSVHIVINDPDSSIFSSEYILQDCKSEDEAKWLSDELNGAMSRCEDTAMPAFDKKPTELFFDPITCMYFRADPEEIRKAVSDFNYDILNRR